MKILLVYAHPEADSFNGALRDMTVKTLIELGHEVQVSDLYAMQFDPVSSRRNFTTVKNPDFLKLQYEEMHAAEHDGFAPDVAAEIAKLKWADLMIWQFPLWWFSVPAMLKGWVDRVFAMGSVYGYGHMYEDGMLRGKRALLSVTTGAGVDAYKPDGSNGDINAVLRPIQRGMLEFVGFEVLRPQIYYSASKVGQEQRQIWLQEWAARLAGIEQETPVGAGRY